MTDEKLTRYQTKQAFMVEPDPQGYWVEHDEAIRIIDAQAAALAARDQHIAELEGELAKREYANPLARLREALAAAVIESGKNAYACRRAVERAEAAEARVRDLEAQLRDGDDADAGMRDRHETTLKQLAAANALLAFYADELEREGFDAGRIRAHLSAQPAASDARERCERCVTRYEFADVHSDYCQPDAHLTAQPPAPECNYVGRCNSSRCPKHGQPASLDTSGLRRIELDSNEATLDEWARYAAEPAAKELWRADSAHRKAKR